jgi:hypothetical protein
LPAIGWGILVGVAWSSVVAAVLWIGGHAGSAIALVLAAGAAGGGLCGWVTHRTGDGSSRRAGASP